jgi:hypothetical protein
MKATTEQQLESLQNAITNSRIGGYTAYRFILMMEKKI